MMTETLQVNIYSFVCCNDRLTFDGARPTIRLTLGWRILMTKGARPVETDIASFQAAAASLVQRTHAERVPFITKV
jgi:hypothetical protein